MVVVGVDGDVSGETISPSVQSSKTFPLLLFDLFARRLASTCFSFVPGPLLGLEPVGVLGSDGLP